jgi:hypothetical protein
MVKLDKIETAELSESKGVIRRVRRTAYVSGLTNIGHERMKQALDSVGVPAAGDVCPGTGFNDLFCTERNVKMLSRDDAEVDLVYELFYESDFVNTYNPPYGVLAGVMRTSIQQVTTNKDENGDLIVLSHTYPADDEDYPSQTVEQGGEVTMYQPQKTLTLRFIRNTNSPWLVTNSILGKLNNSVWGGNAARTWLCTSVSWKVHKVVDVVQYAFEMEFQYNPATWDPTATFIDDRTGKPPKDLVEGTGYKTIELLEEVSFTSILGWGIIGVT